MFNVFFFSQHNDDDDDDGDDDEEDEMAVDDEDSANQVIGVTTIINLTSRKVSQVVVRSFEEFGLNLRGLDYEVDHGWIG